MRRRLATIVLTATLLGLGSLVGTRGAGAVVDRPPTTVTVMPFVAGGAPGHGWLSKALADLLIQHLAEVRSLAIVSREQSEVFARELALGDSPLVSQDSALRMGRVAKVDRVIYGHYLVGGDRIEVTIFVLDVASQQIVQQERLSGSVQQLRTLMQRLVLQLVARQGIALSDAERANIRFEASDSFSATRHFYEGMHLYDLGRHADALGEFSAATKQDARYYEARLWEAKTFESLGAYEHALLSFRELARDAAGAVEGLDALYFAGRLLEGALARRADAIETYKRLAGQRVQAPHVVEAAFRLGTLLEEEGRLREAYDALRAVDDLRERAARDPSVIVGSPLRASRFVGWPHALELHRDAIVRMTLLFHRMLRTSADVPRPPRGVIVVNAENPTVAEPFDARPALFDTKARDTTGWRERYYAVVMPPGYVATGVEMSVTGRLVVAAPNHSYGMRVLDFPLPRDFFRFWLGAIYGQTRERATLRKTISFHGAHRTIFTIQLTNSAAEMDRWAIHVLLRRATAGAVPAVAAPAPGADDAFWEGRPLGRIQQQQRFTSWTGPSEQFFAAPQRELALATDRRGGFDMVGVDGELDGRPTDLWWSRSADGTSWSEPLALPINSASEDYSPQLLRAEDGALWLFWISTRRGLGWELWWSVSRDARSWSDPRRVPLAQLIDAPAAVRAGAAASAPRPLAHILEYAVVQDRRGRWLIACYASETREMVFIRSDDGSAWRVLARVAAASPLHGLALIEDRGGVFRMSALGDGAKVHVWSSRDGSAWQTKTVGIDSPYGMVAPVHRTRLFAQPDGHLVLLVSDTIFGLQYARFRPDAEEPRFDLVSRAGLEAFAAASMRAGGYVVALRQNDGILLRHYRTFNSTGAGGKKYERHWPIYVEEDRDTAGQRWRRITARARFIIPDVTSVGAEPGGRVWWGIESGIMATVGDEFFATDVSQGFFYHFVTSIRRCGGERVWFAADHLDRAIVGYVRAERGGSLDARRTRFETLPLAGASGAVTALECGSERGQVYAATSRGDVVLLTDGGAVARWSLEGAPHVTALAAARTGRAVWAGTRNHGLHELREGQPPRTVPADIALGSITALAVDARGALWLASEGKGLARRMDGRWTAFTPASSKLRDWSIGRLAADPVKGVWYIAHAESRSRGVGYFDGTDGAVHNPPHRILEKPSSLAVDARGGVWIGTWFDGLYKLEPAGTGP